MTTDQVQILAILAITIGMFLWGRWRHDIIALGCLLACVFAGLVPSEQAFSGMGHPAVVTVACVLILSWGLQSTGAVEMLTRHMLPDSTGPTLTIAALTGLGAVLSAFMNNVGPWRLPVWGLLETRVANGDSGGRDQRTFAADCLAAVIAAQWGGNSQFMAL
jgi:Na+/H+ antiporter NhaD/arsenite permease-like protein